MDRLACILMSMALLAAAAVSCGKDAGPEGGIGGSGDGIRFPSGTEYSVGDDVFILCSGIAPDAAVALVSAGGTRTSVEDPVITSSGIFFTLEVLPGSYTVVIEQSGESFELGRINVSAAPIDVTVTEVPDFCIPGEKFTVTGLDFGESAVLTLAAPDGTRTALETEAAPASLTATVPADAPRGKMTLLIVQDEGEMTASETFFITTQKWLTGIDMTLGQTGSGVEKVLGFSRGPDGSLIGSSPLDLSVQAGEQTAYVFTASEEDEANGYGTFTLKMSGGRVWSSTFEVERTDTESGGTVTRTEEFEWEYDGNGFLSYYVAGMTYELVADGRNLDCPDIDGSSMFEYGDGTLVNNPFGTDCTLALLAAASSDHILATALALGTGTRSACLPTGVWSGGDTALPVNYVYDDEGYVIRASYGENSVFPVTVEFTYE